jgi:hypothetical protein
MRNPNPITPNLQSRVYPANYNGIFNHEENPINLFPLKTY